MLQSLLKNNIIMYYVLVVVFYLPDTGKVRPTN